MAIDMLLVEALGDEIAVAFLDDGRLDEYIVGRGGDAFGDIYLGRVHRLHDGLQAAFVDIGQPRYGFLALAEARPPGTAPGADRIGNYVAEGDAVLVQAIRDAVEDKGPKLTRDATLPGRLLIYTPMQPGSRLSKKIAESDRHRLHVDLAALLRPNEGVVVRTAAVSADRSSLERELAYLRGRWEELEQRRTAARAPTLLLAGGDVLAEALVRAAAADIRRIATDDARTFGRLKTTASALVPEIADRISLVREGLFEAEGVPEQVEAALEPAVPLPGGGSLIIEETAALVAIDVNSGGVSDGAGEDLALRVNSAAASEVIRQTRLRNLGGRIVVDFMPMRSKRRREDLLNRLRHAAARERVAIQVLGFTPGGLIELNRQRGRPSLASSLRARCPVCDGDGAVLSPRSVALMALRSLLSETRARPGKVLGIRAGRTVADALAGDSLALRRAAEKRLGRTIAVAADSALDAGAYVIEERKAE